MLVENLVISLGTSSCGPNLSCANNHEVTVLHRMVDPLMLLARPVTSAERRVTSLGNIIHTKFSWT